MSVTAILEPKPAAPELDDAVALFKALADPARLKILEHLRSQGAGCCTPMGSVCACDLEAVTGLAQPTVSHHMKILMSAGLVTGEKQGRWMYYRVDPHGLGLARGALSRLDG